MADDLVGEGGARFESAGSLKNGRRVWMLAKLPETATVADEELTQYLLLSNAHDGTRAMEVLLTPVRVVCWNTLSWAIREAKQKISIRHTENHDSQIRQAKAILDDAESYYAATGELLHKLADTKVDNRFAEAYLQAAQGVYRKLADDDADPQRHDARLFKKRPGLLRDTQSSRLEVNRRINKRIERLRRDLQRIARLDLLHAPIPSPA